MVDHRADLRLGHPGALHTHRRGGAWPQVQGITLAGEGLGTVLVQDDARVQLGSGGEGQPGGHIGLDQSGNYLGHRALGGQHQVDAGGARQLRDALNGGFDVLGSGHHQVRQLVDHHQQVGVGSDHSLGAGQRLHLAGTHRLIEVVDVLEAEGGQVVVAGVHLPHHPLQGLGGLLRGGDDRGDQVRYALVDGQFHALGVHQHHAHLLGRGPHHDGGDHGVDEGGLSGAGLAGHQQVRGLGQVGDHVIALDVLAQAHHQRVRLLLGSLGAQHIPELDHLPVGVGDLHTDGALSGNRGEQTDLIRTDRVGDVLGLAGHPGDVHTTPQVDLITGDLRATRIAGDGGVHTEFGEHVLQPVDNGVIGVGAGGVAVARFKQGVLGKAVGGAVRQLHLPQGDGIGEVLLVGGGGGLLGDGVGLGAGDRGRRLRFRRALLAPSLGGLGGLGGLGAPRGGVLRVRFQGDVDRRVREHAGDRVAGDGFGTISGALAPPGAASPLV